MRKNISILNLSDIHLGHDVNKTENIILNLKRFFKTYHSQIVKVNMIIISGDVFDRLLSSNGADNLMINKWLAELVKFCSNYNIKLRDLEGTPSHEWKQFKNIYNIIDTLNLKVDFKYMENLEIEYIEEYNMNILYIPDEWAPSPEQLLKEVKFKLKEHKLDKVEVAVMHGAFNFQLPDFIDHLLEPKDYLDIVKGPIIIGHVHDRNRYKRILVPGSFDALTHGDDGKAKGGLLIDLNIEDFTFTYKFLENKFRLRFSSIDVTGKDIETIKKILLKKQDKVKQHIRLISDGKDNLETAISELQLLVPLIKLGYKNKNKKVSHSSINEHLVVNKNEVIKLDKPTILKFIEERVIEDELSIELKTRIIEQFKTL